LPVSSNNDRNRLVCLGSTQGFLPTIHGIDGVAVHPLEQIAFGEADLVPKTPLDELPNAKTQHRFVARRKLRDEPPLLQELWPRA
jgi:hypothetical protein